MRIWLLIFTSVLSLQFVNAASTEDKLEARTYPFKDYHKEFEEERKEAEARGEAKGREEIISFVINNLKAAGKTPEDAAKMTGVTIEQVKQIYAAPH